MAISSSAIVLTSLYRGSCVTTTRRVRERGINMQVVCGSAHLHHDGKGADRCAGSAPAAGDHHAVPLPPWLVVPMVGLSCGAFSLLFGGDWPIFLVTCFSASVAMRVPADCPPSPNPLINFAATGFICDTALLSATLLWLGRGGLSRHGGQRAAAGAGVSRSSTRSPTW